MLMIVDPPNTTKRIVHRSTSSHAIEETNDNTLDNVMIGHIMIDLHSMIANAMIDHEMNDQ